jgi:diketogulonate reductase-like aldo/keto reductase
MENILITLKSGLIMPALGVGTTDLTAHNGGSIKMNEAIALGYRLIDTATAYKNQKTVSAAINMSEVDRREIIICTTINDNDLVNSSVTDVVTTMLQELNTDYLDMVLVHSPAVLQHFKQPNVVDELIKLKTSGKIKSIGVSNFSVEHFQLIDFDQMPHIDVNQIELNPFCQQPEMTDFCRRNNIQIMAYRPFGKGKADDLLANECLAKIANDHVKSIPQVILRWLLQKGFSTIPKAGNPEHVAENKEVFDFELSAEEMTSIAGLNRNMITCDWTKYVTTHPASVATSSSALFNTGPATDSAMAIDAVVVASELRSRLG